MMRLPWLLALAALLQPVAARALQPTGVAPAGTALPRPESADTPRAAAHGERPATVEFDAAAGTDAGRPTPARSGGFDLQSWLDAQQGKAADAVDWPDTRLPALTP